MIVARTGGVTVVWVGHLSDLHGGALDEATPENGRLHLIGKPSVYKEFGKSRRHLMVSVLVFRVQRVD